jgi:hypothetical protein
VQLRPNRLQQVSWTNPLTNKILLDAGLSVTTVTYNTTEHRDFTNPREIPRIDEIGNTAGGDDVAPRVNSTCGAFACTSGSLNGSLTQNDPHKRDTMSWRSRASVSYVTGSHNAKLGYDGGYFTNEQTNITNDPQLTYHYFAPAASCLTSTNPLACGTLPAFQFPNDPFNRGLRPRPLNFDMNTGVGTIQDQVMTASLYAQDQWTLKRLTISGALRYDHATSSYGETQVGPNKFVPIQADGRDFYVIPARDGVSYNDITPRWGLAWDIFGTGKTSLKYNGGQYLNQANVGGIYSGANAARRTVNTLRWNWNDADADRIVDCNLTSFTPNGECTSLNAAFADVARFGRDPFAGGGVGIAQVHCGRQDTDERDAISAQVIAYCDAYGDTLLNGWGKRPGEWQHGLGIQHEILPRLSGEFTWNRRSYYNLTVQDTLNVGCDRFNGAQEVNACLQGYLNYTSATEDFYSVTAPLDPRLPGGGGYRILGLSTAKASQPTGQPDAISIFPALERVYNGFDTNFVWRGPRGFRVNGGTSTGRTQRDTCFSGASNGDGLDSPDVRGREGREYEAGCRPNVPWSTRVNGTASYVIPWVDVLVSTVFQSLPGDFIGANLEYTKDQVIWAPGSEARATRPCTGGVAAAGVGCFGLNADDDDQSVPLLLTNEFQGERTTLFDMKFAKNIRFANKRATIGVDVYNVFNSDAITGYNDDYIIDNPATPAVEANPWQTPTSIVAPRFVRLSVQFSF